MNRKDMLNKLQEPEKVWDMVVVGGGATGLGVAVDAATRGYSVVLLEMADFAKSTSSRSTKLVHGGVRYLQKGDVALVLEALRERGRMKANAPHLVKDQAFVISNYTYWDNFLYFCGLTLYDLLSFGFGYGRSRFISPKKVMEYLPTSVKKGLKGGIVYHDGQFDDSRMAISLVLTAIDKGGVCLNYIKVDRLLKDATGKINGVHAVDSLDGKEYHIKAKVVVNATGVFVDDVMKMDERDTQRKVRPSQGVHLVVDSKFLGGHSALMIPKTNDGRVLFGVPWHGKVVLGTTDTPLDEASLEPRALEEEVDFILDQAGQYLDRKPTRADVLSIFAGLRPLAAPTHADSKKTKEISRNHKIYRSKSGLLTITGGKWTTYRAMAEDVINQAIAIGGLSPAECVTKNLKVHGYTKAKFDENDWDYVYGSDADKIQKMIEKEPSFAEKLYEGYTFTAAHVVWAAREEFAQNIEDVLARRVRILFLDARAALKVAPKVASVLAMELGKDKTWEQEQVADFNQLARGYILN